MTLDAGRYAMILDKDVRVPTRDGTVLRANVFRPDSTETFPVLMTFGPYGKDIHLSQFMPEAWEHLKKGHPTFLRHPASISYSKPRTPKCGCRTATS